MTFSDFQGFLNRASMGGSLTGGIRTADFRDKNFNGIDDRDERGGVNYNPNNPKKPVRPAPEGKGKPANQSKTKPKPKPERTPRSNPVTGTAKKETPKAGNRKRGTQKK